jgi:phosphomannomutase
MKPLKIGISSIRGVVGETLTPELLVDFACAFGTFVDGGAVAVAHDSRKSAPMVRAAVLAGLQSCGCTVIDGGLLPTPILQHLVRSKHLPGGISITASHNDSQWNALKFVGENGSLLNPYQSEQVMDIYHLGEFRKSGWDRLGNIMPDSRAARMYFRFLRSKLDASVIRDRRFHVAVDACSGAGARFATGFLESLGCKVTALNDEPDGEFPHSPEPSAANMRGLASVVRSVGADLGFLLNSDVDRIGAVAGGGVALSEEYILPILADSVLAGKKGSVVSTYSTSRMVDSVAERYGRKVLRSRIGEGYVVQRVLLEKAAIGGEGSGGVVVPAWCSWFDGFAVMGLLLETLASTGRSLADAAAALPKYHMIKGSTASSTERMYRIIEFFRHRYREHAPNLEDGVRVDWPHSWIHVRASNTEPLIRVIVESEDAQKARELFTECMDQIARLQG